MTEPRVSSPNWLCYIYIQTLKKKKRHNAKTNPHLQYFWITLPPSSSYILWIRVVHRFPRPTQISITLHFSLSLSQILSLKPMIEFSWTKTPALTHSLSQLVFASMASISRFVANGSKLQSFDSIQRPSSTLPTRRPQSRTHLCTY